MMMNPPANTPRFSEVKYFTALTAALLILTTGLFAQSQSDYDAMKKMLSSEKYQAFKEWEPDKAAEYVYMNRHGYHVSDAGDKDFSSYPDVFELEAVYPNEPPMTLALFENNQWNMHAYGVLPDKGAHKYYRIGETGKVLTILPETLAKKKMNKETKQK